MSRGQRKPAKGVAVRSVKVRWQARQRKRGRSGAGQPSFLTEALWQRGQPGILTPFATPTNPSPRG